MTKHIPSTLKPYPAWQLNGKRVLGTHYVRSITYGGELIASLKFKADTESTLEKIKVALKVGFKVSRTKIVEFASEKVKKEVRDICCHVFYNLLIMQNSALIIQGYFSRLRTIARFHTNESFV